MRHEAIERDLAQRNHHAQRFERRNLRIEIFPEIAMRFERAAEPVPGPEPAVRSIEQGIAGLTQSRNTDDLSRLQRKVETIGARRYTSIVDLELTTRFARLPYIRFELDAGEKNRQHLDELSKELENNA